MNRAGTESLQSHSMRGRSVALMLFQPIARETDRQGSHQSIACDLGYDGGGSNGQDLLIPFGNGPLADG